MSTACLILGGGTALGSGLFAAAWLALGERRSDPGAKPRRAIPIVTAALASVGLATAAFGASADGSDAVKAALSARLPKTKITKIDCDKTGTSLCEVTAGDNLFYVDRSARYLIVGRVYDMETRQDLTAARLLEIDPDRMVGGAVLAQRAKDGEAQSAEQVAGAGQFREVRQRVGTPKAQPQASMQRVSLDGLPQAGAIVWGRGSRTVTVFSDFRCSYCRALSNALSELDVRVVERPISVLGSRELSERVYCASDKHRAVKAAYAGEPLAPAKCDTSGLDANERFARARGFTGTPVIVRSDGAVLEGYRPKEFLAQWLKEARS